MGRRRRRSCRIPQVAGRSLELALSQLGFKGSSYKRTGRGLYCPDIFAYELARSNGGAGVAGDLRRPATLGLHKNNASSALVAMQIVPTEAGNHCNTSRPS